MPQVLFRPLPRRSFAPPFILAINTNSSNLGVNNTDGLYFLIASTIGAGGAPFTLTQDFAVTDGQTYTVSYDVGTRINNGAAEYIQISAGGQSLTSVDTEFAADEVYYPKSFEFTASGSSATLQILSNAAQGFYVDNVRVLPTTP